MTIANVTSSDNVCLGGWAMSDLDWYSEREASLEHLLAESVTKAKVERRHAGSPSMALFSDRARTMADDTTVSSRIYHHLGHVCLDKDTTALVMVVPFAYVNKVRS
jgi:hypothetical protein